MTSSDGKEPDSPSDTAKFLEELNRKLEMIVSHPLCPIDLIPDASLAAPSSWKDQND